MKFIEPRGSLLFSAALILPLLSLGGARGPGENALAQGESATGNLAGQITFDGGPAPAGVVTGDAVVYLVGDGLAKLAGDELAGAAHDGPRPVLNQSDIAFVPHVVTVVAGREVEIKNSDAIMHNVNAGSRENRPFNKSQLAGMSASVTFHAPEIVPIRCDVHSQMSAYIAVVPNRFFARPDASGAYRIENVPAGTYQLVGWHEKYGTVTSEITVGDSQTVTSAVNFTSN